jgi:hypothetical protein
MSEQGTTKEKVLKGSDWVLIWSWAVFALFLGPFLISARDSLMVFVGFGILAALIYFTQRRIVPIIQEKIK